MLGPRTSLETLSRRRMTIMEKKRKAINNRIKRKRAMMRYLISARSRWTFSKCVADRSYAGPLKKRQKRRLTRATPCH